MRKWVASLGVGFALTAAAVVPLAQGRAPFRLSRDHPAIEYSTRPATDAITRLNARLAKGDIELTFEPLPRGYLHSVLKALDISAASQTLVFSENSLQRAHISKSSPRAIYFNDSVAVGWSQGADSMEVTALDPAQGIQFYSIAQAAAGEPRFERRQDCLECHLMPQITQGVPGLFAMSQLPLSDNQNEYAQGWPTDHRTPIEDRWGGWYVTGAQVPLRHLGNVAVTHVPKSYVREDQAPKLESGAEAFDASRYLTPFSDVVALLVLNHQVEMTNLLIRLGWEARVAEFGVKSAIQSPQSRVQGPDVQATAREVVDYMLFVDESPLPSVVKGGDAFAEEFAAKSPRDRKGRSLRQFDLTRRLFRYPCSYMIYTEAFDALPQAAKAAVYQRLWDVLSGRDTDKAYAVLTAADRTAILEILRETKTGLPEYFH